MQFLWQIIFWFSLPVLAVLAVLLLYRNALSQFPYFVYYILAGEIIGLIRLLLYNPAGRVYFYAYYMTDVLFAVFSFLAAYELFVKRLFPHFYSVRFYRYLFPAAGLLLTLISVPAAVLAHHRSILLPLIHGLGVLQVTTLLFFVGLMIFMGRRWGRYEFGIALGLGIQAAAVLATSARWVRSPFVQSVLDRLPVIAYDIACIIWLITFLKPEKQIAVPSGPITPEILTEARKWQEAAKGTVTKKKDSG